MHKVTQKNKRKILDHLKVIQQIWWLLEIKYVVLNLLIKCKNRKKLFEIYCDYALLYCVLIIYYDYNIMNIIYQYHINILMVKYTKMINHNISNKFIILDGF